MSEGLAVFILVNNYFHDIATAMFLASGVAMRVLVKNAEGKKIGKIIGCFYDLPGSVRRLGRFSLYWILLGGIPRILAFRDFELKHAINKNQVPGLLIEHIIAFMFVIGGMYFWIKINSRTKNPGKND